MIASDESGEVDAHRRGINRRSFLSFAGNVVFGAGLAAVLPGEPWVDESRTASLSRWSGSLRRLNMVETAGFIEELVRAGNNCHEFVKGVPELVMAAGGVISSKRLQSRPDYWVRFFPPEADRLLLELMESEIRVGLAQGGLDKTKGNDKKWKQALRGRVDFVTSMIGDRREDPDWRPDGVVSRWKGNISEFPGTETTANELTLRLTGRFPVLNRMDVEFWGGLKGAMLMAMFIGASYDESSDTIKATLGDPSMSEIMSRLVALVLCHEMAHGLDLTIAPFLSRYISNDRLIELYSLRLASMDLSRIIRWPFEKASVDMFGYKGKETPNGEMRPQGQIMSKRNLGDLSVGEIESAALVYPRVYLKPDAEKTISLEVDGRLPFLSDGRAKEVIYAGSQALNENLAELGGILMYLASGIEGEVKSRLIQELVSQNPAVRYVAEMIKTLGYETIDRMLESGSYELSKELKLPVAKLALSRVREGISRSFGLFTAV